jgi:hypothetical protein
MGIFSKKEVGRGSSGLEAELKLRLHDGYFIVQKTDLEALVTRNPKKPGGYLLFEKPDGTVGVYVCESNPFLESGGILDKMKKKWRS